MSVDLPSPPRVRGWLVVRNYPPEFGAFFDDRSLVEANTRELGPDFKAKLGDHLPGTDQFKWGVDHQA